MVEHTHCSLSFGLVVIIWSVILSQYRMLLLQFKYVSLVAQVHRLNSILQITLSHFDDLWLWDLFLLLDTLRLVLLLVHTASEDSAHTTGLRSMLWSSTCRWLRDSFGRNVAPFC